MKKILIADASKASLVITSEVFKDHFPGVHVLVARSSAEALEIAKSEEKIDAFVIDYDLPDRDGAYTAARIKRMFSTPVLITAYDRPDVQENIEKNCSAYDDCLSWLAKPVNSELVISIAHRFIEGNYRTQRRVDCMIPGVAEVTVRIKLSALKAVERRKLGQFEATKLRKQPFRTKEQEEVDEDENVHRVCLPVMVEDCSVGGFKFRIMKKDILEKKFFKFTASNKLNIEPVVSVFLPSFDSIQTGEENVGYWLWGDSKANEEEESAVKEKPAKGRRTKTPRRTTLSFLKRFAKKNLGDKNHEGQAIKGTVVWNRKIDDHDAIIGMKSENLVLCKRLFEAILLGENKIKTRVALQEEQKERSRLHSPEEKEQAKVKKDKNVITLKPKNSEKAKKSATPFRKMTKLMHVKPEHKRSS